MRLCNAHTAAIEGVLPGDVGEFPAMNPGVQALIKHGHLVAEDLSGDTPAEFTEAAHLRAMLEDERARFDREKGKALRYVEEVEGENTRLRARVAELEAAASKKPSKASKTDPAPSEG